MRGREVRNGLILVMSLSQGPFSVMLSFNKTCKNDYSAGDNEGQLKTLYFEFSSMVSVVTEK